jgi:hypothetical protein
MAMPPLNSPMTNLWTGEILENGNGLTAVRSTDFPDIVDTILVLSKVTMGKIESHYIHAGFDTSEASFSTLSVDRANSADNLCFLSEVHK